MVLKSKDGDIFLNANYFGKDALRLCKVLKEKARPKLSSLFFQTLYACPAKKQILTGTFLRSR